MKYFKSHPSHFTRPFAHVLEEKIEISKSYNPNFINLLGHGCTRQACFRPELKLVKSLRFVVQNKNGLWETAMNCPKFGCQSDGPIDFNELVSNGANLLYYSGLRNIGRPNIGRFRI